MVDVHSYVTLSKFHYTNTSHNMYRHWTVRPFTHQMKLLSQYVYKYVSSIYSPGRCSINDPMQVMKFNSATMLFYYGKSGKTVTQLSYHRDQQYWRDGSLNPLQNSQTPYTPTCVLTVGHSRVMRFILSDGKNDDRYSHIQLKPLHLCHGSLFILHPCDEIPRQRSKFIEHSNEYLYFKHGGVKHGPNDGLSVAFVFRNVNRQVRVGDHGNIVSDQDNPELDRLDDQDNPELDRLDDLLDEYAEHGMAQSELLLRNYYNSMRHIYRS